ncbi:hypothetical protein M406DRAFT_70252 [Cryphonectria parasitica EP155]|uniref:Uncharacterized protein n=1 Tax=Cryphonectria parasitica (strain ATCC 38755 / EP155) TaxID=660469 RepID=A0A9P4Y731_CRYP1|nr:uncharacterized protein M406DRAFT_70252 [Cryphonectria parasitica EP155]KAF3768159.1 hypothetical protein M406DRAFT_70252 [Cryphonectria parasitica EP155]
MHVSIISAIAGLVAAGAVSACACTNNADAGRWVDSSSPGAVAADLATEGGGCRSGSEQGYMCVSITNPNESIEECMANFAINAQSYHSDWFLWTSIDCTDGDSTATLSITGSAPA